MCAVQILQPCKVKRLFRVKCIRSKKAAVMMDRHKIILNEVIRTAKSMTSDEEQLAYLTLRLLVNRILVLEKQLSCYEDSDKGLSHCP